MNEPIKEGMFWLTLGVCALECVCLYDKVKFWRLLAIQSATVVILYSLLIVVRSLMI